MNKTRHEANAGHIRRWDINIRQAVPTVSTVFSFVAKRPSFMRVSSAAQYRMILVVSQEVAVGKTDWWTSPQRTSLSGALDIGLIGNFLLMQGLDG